MKIKFIKMINQEEVNALLASEIRKKGLNDTLKLDVIREKVMKKIQEMSSDTSQEVNEMENPAVAQGPTEFPNPANDEESFHVAPNIINTGDTQVGMKAGAQPLNVQIEPKMAIIPEVPDFLKEVQPGKFFVFDFNELSVGGENLSNKPFKTMENPDVCKSMQQMWSENGITKAEVYQTKFEKIGEVVFDYKSGSSQFIEMGAQPDFDIQQQYKQNPYVSQPDKEIENYIKGNVDLDQKINDVVTNIVKNYFLTNSERAVETQPAPHPHRVPDVTFDGNITQVNEGKVTLRDLVSNDSGFKKIDTPQELLETITGKAKTAQLVYEDKEVKKWVLDNKEYYLPSDAMSIKKCYVK